MKALQRLPVRKVLGPRLGGIGISGAIPFVSSRGLRVLCEAILFRIFAVIPSAPTPGAFEVAWSLRTSLFRSFLSCGARPMDRWEWIKTMPSRRRKQLIRAAKALEERGELSHKFRFIKAFVKTEKLPYFGVRGDVYGVEFAEYVARLIQAPHDETHLLAGPWLKPLCHYLKQDWSWDNWLFYASVAPEDLDRWLNRNKSALSWFWADYSSFDSTYSSSAWLMIERLYSAIYPDAPLGFWAALDAWRQPEGRISLSKDEAVIWYLASIMNASGRDDTADRKSVV